MYKDNKLAIGIGSKNPKFIGPNAVEEYNKIFDNTEDFIPLEADGESGTAYSHWDEDLFGSELMTGIMSENGEMPISSITIAALADLGYQVNMEAADTFIPEKLVDSTSEFTIVFDIHANSYVLRGNDENNTIDGTKDSEILEGKGGKDKLIGDKGNDTLIGGDGKDKLVGGKGADILIGGDGKDNLAGGKGADQFVINLNDSHIDKIKDFSNKDTIVITDSNFDNVELIPLEANQFTQDSSATTDRHRVLYDDGDIFWDSDGIGEAKPVKIANLSNNPLLQSSNILIESNP